MNTIIENGWINNVTIYANRKNLRPTKNENWVDFRIENVSLILCLTFQKIITY